MSNQNVDKKKIKTYQTALFFPMVLVKDDDLLTDNTGPA
jgi:hypothetical protein